MNVLGKKTKSCSTKGINANYLENTILDLVLDTINSSNLYKELNSASRERIKFLNGINGKNQIILDNKRMALEGLLVNMTNCTNELIKQAINRQVERLVLEISDVESKIAKIKEEIIRLNESKNNITISKEEMLANRDVARSIIKEIVKSIIVDEINDDIEIELY